MSLTRRAKITLRRMAAVMLPSLLAFGLCPRSGAAQPPPRGAATLIRNVNVVTLDERGVLPGAAVLVRDGRIASILPAGARVPAAAVVIDGRGGYLIPGLIDAHVHHGTDHEMTGFLRYGVTTVFALGARPEDRPALLDLRRRIAAGRLAAPHVYATGSSIGGMVLPSTPEEATAYVDSLHRDGLEYIKVYNNIQQPVFDRVVADARRHGMGVFGHMPRGFPPEYTITHGLQVLAHMEELFFTTFGGARDAQLDSLAPDWAPDLNKVDPILDLLARNGVAIIPNLVASATFANLWLDEAMVVDVPDTTSLAPETADAYRRLNSSHRSKAEKRALREQIKSPLLRLLTYRAWRKNVLLLAGSDAIIPGVFPGRSLHQELRLLVAAGLSNEQALRTATVNGGLAATRFVDRGAQIGVIRVGSEADVVLLRSNPLDDIRNTQTIVGVMSDGRWWTREELDALARRP